uniref:Uncharacterized protein n=1 Tax=Arundo donax TaxID=35708 RepID=A0A0A9ELD4_ARUDO
MLRFPLTCPLCCFRNGTVLTVTLTVESCLDLQWEERVLQGENLGLSYYFWLSDFA